MIHFSDDRFIDKDKVKEIFNMSIEVEKIINKQDLITKYVTKKYINPSTIRLLNVNIDNKRIVTLRKNKGEYIIFIYHNNVFTNDNVSYEYICKVLNEFYNYLYQIYSFRKDYNNIISNNNIDVCTICKMLKKYPYVMITYKFFKDNCYIYSKDNNKIYDENDNIFENFNFSMYYYRTGWKILGIKEEYINDN